MKIHPSIRAAVAALAVAVPGARAAAQVYLVDPGTPYVAGGLASSMTWSALTGTPVEVRFSDGSTSGGVWGFLFSVGPVDWYGVQNSLFTMLARGDRDTYGSDPTENDLNVANTNPSGETLVGFRLSGAPAGVVFDRTFGFTFGTPGSAGGLDIVEANDPGGNEFQMTVTYRNLVQLAGDPPVGDVFETLDVAFGNPIPEDENYSLILDTDRARTLVAAPEPATVGLLGAGLLALAAAARRRARG